MPQAVAARQTISRIVFRREHLDGAERKQAGRAHDLGAISMVCDKTPFPPIQHTHTQLMMTSLWRAGHLLGLVLRVALCELILDLGREACDLTE